MQTYQVVRIEPQIETITKKKKLYDRDGREVGAEDVVKKYQVVHVTDGLKYEGAITDYLWYAPPNSVDVGDLVSAFDQNGSLWDVTITRGRNAVAQPAPAAPPAPMQPLPENTAPQAESWRFSVASGYAATPADLASFAQAFFVLEQKHKNLADAFRSYVATHP